MVLRKRPTRGAPAVDTTTATRPKQVYEVFINASPERIWEALTSPEFTQQYFHGTRVESDLRPGSPFLYHSGDGSSVLVEGEVVESDPPRRLVHTWRMLYEPELAADAPTRVTWEIEPGAGGVSKLTVVHDDFAGETSTYKYVAGGWSWILSNLKTLLETGEAFRG